MRETAAAALRIVDHSIVILSKFSLVLAAICVILLMFIGSLDNFSIWLLWRSIPSGMEFQQSFEAALIFLALASVQHTNSHISLDLMEHLFGIRARRLSRIFGLVVISIFYFLLTWQAYRMTTRSYEFDEMSPGRIAFAIYPFKALIFFGLSCALLEALRQIVRCFIGDADEVTSDKAVHP